RKEEHEVFEVCKSKVRQRLLPMNVIDAEYQFDRHKLTFFFEADRRIDFRELVRDLFAIYKTRIWLQQDIKCAAMRDELREVDEERGETSNHGNSMESTAGQESTDAVSSSSWTRVKSRKKSTGVLLWEKRSVKAKQDSGPVTYSVRSSTTVNAPINMVLKTLDASVATAHRSFTRIIYGNLVADTSVLFHSSTLGTAFLAEDANDSFEMLAVRWLDNDEDEISVGYSHEGLHALDEMPVAYKLFRSMETRHCPELLESHRVVRSKVPLGGFLFDRQFRALQSVVKQMAHQIDRLNNAVDSYKMSLHLESLRTLQWWAGTRMMSTMKSPVVTTSPNTPKTTTPSPIVYRSFETLQLYEDILLKLCENSASVRNSKFVALTLFTRANHADMSQQNEVEAGEVAVYYLKVKGSAKLMKVAANMRCCDPVLQLHKPVITRNTWALDSKSSVHSSGYDFRQLPIVLGPQQARFYAGVPLTDSKKRFRYGALAVFDAAINPGEDDDLPMKKTLQALQESLDGDSDDNDKIDEAQRRLDYELRNARTKSDPEFPNSGSKARAQDTQAQMVENSLVMERHGVPIV
uniref:PSP1 C-terminal domain-containing protein n=1 Tax=Phytophthora ramorum TaxID=164328 RepID=H3HCT2_PHYRM